MVIISTLHSGRQRTRLHLFISFDFYLAAITLTRNFLGVVFNINLFIEQKVRNSNPDEIVLSFLHHFLGGEFFVFFLFSCMSPNLILNLVFKNILKKFTHPFTFYLDFASLCVACKIFVMLFTLRILLTVVGGIGGGRRAACSFLTAGTLTVSQAERRC